MLRSGQHVMKVVSYNIQYGRGKDDRYESTAVGLRLDYVFVTPTLRDNVKAAWIDNDAQGSDHQPMWAELDV
jgi:endonuclease/exonuclease/phosphatase family metal-dependent hydrolase